MSGRFTISSVDVDQSPELRSAWVGAWRRFRRNKAAVFGLVYVAVLISVAVFAPIIAPYGYTAVNYDISMQPPSWSHPLGTDELGRDILSRIMYGTRPLLLVGVFTQVLGLAIGIPIGVLSGYLGGWVDWVVAR